MDLTSFHNLVKADTDSALLELVEQLPENGTDLKNAMKHALLAGGKRMRPLLVHLIGHALNISKQDLLVVSMAIECIHAYSLVHDDLPAMDDDDLRRGKPTCHIAYDEATAILAGDSLQTLAFSILSSHPMTEASNSKRIELVKLLASASGYLGMCGGQAIDLVSTGAKVNIERLTQLHRLKTGALLEACVSMVTLLDDNITDSSKEHFVTFASAIGLAFQVQDDILDVTSSTNELGKPKGSDEALGKNTFPALLGLEGAKQELSTLHTQALKTLEKLNYNTEYLVAYTDLMINRKH